MKKLLALILLSVAALAHAQAPTQGPTWERYAQSGEAIQYFDKFRRVLMSGMAFVWDLHDLRGQSADTGKAWRSVLYPTEVNCRTVQKRVLSTHKMSGPMGSGDTIEEDTLVGPWVDVRPDTADHRLMVAACTP